MEVVDAMQVDLRLNGRGAIGGFGLPGWVPQGVRHYLAHTETGEPIRALAREAGCHASTILRQIRRIETRRDDPLVDAALRHLIEGPAAAKPQTSIEENRVMTKPQQDALPDETKLNREALRILRRLCETGAVLAVAAQMDKAVVVRETAGGSGARTAVVEASVAQAMALKDWISATNAGRIIRYTITSAGRAALEELMSKLGDDGTGAAGFAESQSAFSGKTADDEMADDIGSDARGTRRVRYSLAESPLTALARRRDRSGEAFLSDALVHAGERLREDFELAQMGARVAQNWDHFLTAGTGGAAAGSGGGDAPARARLRVASALADLGPGLSDVVLRCCCYLEGLEAAEKRLGWSARSGKIVLRIALMRLKRHYDETTGPGGALIG